MIQFFAGAFVGVVMTLISVTWLSYRVLAEEQRREDS